jgi:predicted O-linked N-acetylglucosamine transferase (SPINDLY family)
LTEPPTPSPSPDALLASGFALHRDGRLAEAAACYEAAIACDPANAVALHLRGALAHQAGDNVAALSFIDRAIERAPRDPRFRANRGRVLDSLGRFADAAEAHREAAMLAPGDADAQWRHASAMLRIGRFADALAAIDATLSLRPGAADVHLARGAALGRLGRDQEALDAYANAIVIAPRFTAAHFNRGNVLARLERWAEALDGYRTAASLAPRFTEARIRAANAQFRLGRPDDALATYDEALALEPDNAIGQANRASCLLALGRAREALAGSKRAIAIDPRHPDAHVVRGNALMALRRFADATAAYRTAHETGYANPDIFIRIGNAQREIRDFDAARAAYLQATAAAETSASAWFSLGNVARDLSDPATAAQHYDRAYAIDPGLDHLAGARLLNAMTIADWRPLETLLADHGQAALTAPRGFSPFSLLGLIDDPGAHLEASRIWARKWRPRADREPFLAPAPDRRIRIGYFCTDFRAHATSFLIAGMLELHDRDRFECVGFSLGPPQADGMRARLVAAFDDFVECHDAPDDEVVALARRKRIDIAIDLNGYATTNRPGIFAQRCAAVQISMLAYPGTTALPEMDYLVADHIVVPPGDERFYTEKIIRMPGSYQMNDHARPTGRRAWSRRELGLPETGIVFCCFNNNFKILPPTFDGWMRILAATPSSVLWLLADNPTAARNLREAARARGVDQSRLIFAQRAELDDHIARHRCADLFLDTSPYNAHTTASDALWAGLPVLTCLGRSFPARVAASLLHAVGLPELVTTSQASYEAAAIQLAADTGRLAALRARLVRVRAHAPLFDTRRYARAIEEAFRTAHATRLAGLAPDHIEVTAPDGA